ncbi:hypothetical protein B0A53_04621 [Rhodotorula sp. CCFEE 5036]|nr:hypothetical protein B0A53_04621 [Rhodotorula sp. CCFEE 5036]
MAAASSPAPTPTATATATPAPESALLTVEDKQLLAATTTHEKLLVSQAVFEKGTADWKGVAGLLKGHKLINAQVRGNAWFEPKRLARLWTALMHETGHEETLQFAAQDSELRAIAHHYYMARVRELYAGMEACQDQFRSVAHLQFSLTIPSLFEGPIIFSEIEELKEGKLDWKLTQPDRVAPPGTTNSPLKVLPAQLPPLADLPKLPPSTTPMDATAGEPKPEEEGEEADVQMEEDGAAAAAAAA